MDAEPVQNNHQNPPSPPPPPPPDHSSTKLNIYASPNKYKTKKRKPPVFTRRPQIQPDSPPQQPNSDEPVLDDKLEDKSSNSAPGYLQKSVVINDFFDYNNSGMRAVVMEHAKEFQQTLDVVFPSFLKQLVRSNVTVGFWMHLPMPFCKLHLPKSDTTVTLDVVNGREYRINYIADRTALSGGWKNFCSRNDLHEGDVLVFHMLEPLKFKVYVVRSSDIFKGTVDLPKVEQQLNLEDPAEQDGETNGRAENLMTMDLNETENHHDSTNLEAFASLASAIDFKDVDGIENFSILINGLSIDSGITNHQRTVYYELCCSQNSYLHENLLQSINYKLATEIIIGIVNISEAIRASNLSSSNADFKVWDQNLKGFELLGMNVGFLRSRLNRLMSLTKEAEEAVEEENREIRQQQARIDEEIRSIELKLMDLRGSRERLDRYIESMRLHAERHERKFQEAVNARW